MSASAAGAVETDRADLLAYYLFAMKYGEHMQQPEEAQT
jgi:hypothetical protein